MSPSGLASLPPLVVGPHVIARPIVLAPMAGVSESPYRVIALELGAGLAPTELVSAKGLMYDTARTREYLRRDANVERPFSVQIFGGDPESVARGAEKAVLAGADIVDLNMGCPVKKVVRNGGGSALLCDPPRAEAIVRAVRAVVGERVAVTVKIRSGWDERSVNAPEVARRLAGAGAAAIAVHPRTRAQGYAGRADWAVIRAVVAAVDVPVIGNGDIHGVAEADRIVRETGCAAVMIGRAALGNPWVFRTLAAAHAGGAAPPPTPAERAELVLRHLAAHVVHVGHPRRAVFRFRSHLMWYSRGLAGAAELRAKILTLEDPGELAQVAEAYFAAATPAGIAEAASYDERQAFG